MLEFVGRGGLKPFFFDRELVDEAVGVVEGAGANDRRFSRQEPDEHWVLRR